MINTVDGERLDRIKLENFIKHLPMKDTSEIFVKADKLNSLIGINADVAHVCGVCGLTYKSPFRPGSDFFRPS